MINRKIKNLMYYKSFANEYRRQIFDLCKQPKSFTQLKDILKISTGALVHHLKVLEDEGLIKKEQIKVNDRFKVGRELKITSILEKLGEVFESQKKYAEEQLKIRFPESRQKKIFEEIDNIINANINARPILFDRSNFKKEYEKLKDTETKFKEEFYKLCQKLEN